MSPAQKPSSNTVNIPHQTGQIYRADYFLSLVDFSIMSMKGHVLNSPGVYVLWTRILFFVQHIPSFVKVSTFTMFPRLPSSNVSYYLLLSMIAKLESSRLPNLYPQVKFVCMSGCAYKIK